MSHIQRALISVSDKTGLIAFAQQLSQLGIEILSTGGTAQLLTKEGITVTEVADYTGFPEMMAGRVKTLHPKIHGGLLGRRGLDEAVMAAHHILPIDLLVVNLYPFEKTIQHPDCDLTLAIENIDIGGPAMLRSAAKNYSAVTAIVDPQDYPLILAEMTTHQGTIPAATRFKLAQKVFAHTAKYDSLIANYLGGIDTPQDASFPDFLTFSFQKKQSMRYGENPHQKAAFYQELANLPISVTTSKQLQGKELSYNNVADADAALECVKTFTDPACVIVKHANPCGVALGTTIQEAYQRAFQTDPTSAFGGIIAFNRPLDKATAATLIEKQFAEVIIAPEIDNDALTLLAAKPSIRVLACGFWTQSTTTGYDFKRVTGGLLIQERDNGLITINDLTTVTQRTPTEAELKDLLFAWQVVKFVKSNAIVYCKNQMTLGIGAGQMSRVYSAKIAAIKAEEEKLSIQSAVMASDAFFPFRDGIDAAFQVGITAVIQPGGSMRDNEVIAAANEHGMAMVFTGMRHFRH